MPKKQEKPTRPDLDDQHWLVWLRMQPENKGIDVDALYRNMLTWCQKRGQTPTRLRLLNWLKSERDSHPMTLEPAYFKDAGSQTGGNPTSREGAPSPKLDPNQEMPPCRFCGQKYCLKLHREDPK